MASVGALTVKVCDANASHFFFPFVFPLVKHHVLSLTECHHCSLNISYTCVWLKISSERHRGPEQGGHLWCAGKCLTTSFLGKSPPWFCRWLISVMSMFLPQSLRIDSQLKTADLQNSLSSPSSPVFCSVPSLNPSSVFSSHGDCWAHLDSSFQSFILSPAVPGGHPGAHLICFFSLRDSFASFLMSNIWKLLLCTFFRLFRQEGVWFSLPQSY